MCAFINAHIYITYSRISRAAELASREKHTLGVCRGLLIYVAKHVWKTCTHTRAQTRAHAIHHQCRDERTRAWRSLDSTTTTITTTNPVCVCVCTFYATCATVCSHPPRLPLERRVFFCVCLRACVGSDLAVEGELDACVCVCAQECFCVCKKKRLPARDGRRISNT